MIFSACGSQKSYEANLNEEKAYLSQKTKETDATLLTEASNQANLISSQDSILNFEAKQRESNPYVNSSFAYNIIDTESNTFGYTISIDGEQTINQTTIPGQPGTLGFSTKYKADKAANFIIYKIKNNIMPPSVTKAELDSLGVL